MKEKPKVIFELGLTYYLRLNRRNRVLASGLWEGRKETGFEKATKESIINEGCLVRFIQI